MRCDWLIIGCRGCVFQRRVFHISFRLLFSPLPLTVPVFLTCSERLGVDLMRVLTASCLSVCEHMESGARALDCLSVCRSFSGVRGHRRQTSCLPLERGCSGCDCLMVVSQDSTATCQSGPTCPAGTGGRKKTGSAVNRLCRSDVYLNAGHLTLLPSVSLTSEPIQRLIHPITAVCAPTPVTRFTTSVVGN